MTAKRKPPRVSRVKVMSEDTVRRIMFSVLEETGILDGHRNMEQIASKAATEAVHSVLLSLGINTKEPLEAQATFQSIRRIAAAFDHPDVKEDMSYVRKERQASEQTQRQWRISVIGGVCAVIASALTVFVKEYLFK